MDFHEKLRNISRHFGDIGKNLGAIPDVFKFREKKKKDDFTEMDRNAIVRQNIEVCRILESCVELEKC